MKLIDVEQFSAAVCADNHTLAHSSDLQESNCARMFIPSMLPVPIGTGYRRLKYGQLQPPKIPRGIW